MLKIREGKDYKFSVEKELTLPDDSLHFMVKGPDSNKYLIPFSRYSHYNIRTGTILICRVDRINCKGEVFLEPQNPWYSEGKSYPFEVVGRDERIDKSGLNHTVIVVIDRIGNKIYVPHNETHPFPVIGTNLNLTVERITKGKIHLISVHPEVTGTSLRTGSKYEFVIKRIERGMDDEEYFVIEDIFGTLHTIPREFYEYYGLSVGEKFRGKIIRYKKNGEKTIEPENPFYKPGSTIKLEITSFTKNIINPAFTLNLKDRFGFIHCLESPKPPDCRFITCRIGMIKKGKPLLEPM